MSRLHEMRCVACRGGDPPLNDVQIAEFLPQVAEWNVREIEGVKRLERTYRFRDFSSAMAFTVRVGSAADAEEHHPLIITEWGKVTVQWWTHKIRGLHTNDFIMASKTDRLFGT